MFVYSQDHKSFYKCLTESNGTFTKLFMITIQGSARMEKHLIPPGYFKFNSESGFTHISTTESLTDSTMDMGGRNMCF